jgi:RHS repeat-associated protein
LSTDGTSGTVHTLAGTGALVADEWAQIVASRSSGTVKLSVDGTEVASMTDPGAAHNGPADLLVGENLAGAIDEVRLSTSDRVAAGTVGKTEVNYRYNARNQLTVEYAGPEVAGDPPSNVSVKIYTYDRNGNVTDIVETAGLVEVSCEGMTYDELNRMLTHTGPKGTESFGYRGAEWHRYSANGTSFLYDGDNVLADVAGGTVDFYVTPFLDQNLSITNAADTHYYSQDGLGSARTLTDSLGVAVNSYDYLPFGEAYQPGTSVTVEQRYTYTGREKNPSSLLMYYRYRQYDPRVGRFEGRDPLLHARLETGELYPYGGNAPTVSIDPHGLHQLRLWEVDQDEDGITISWWLPPEDDPCCEKFNVIQVVRMKDIGVVNNDTWGPWNIDDGRIGALSDRSALSPYYNDHHKDRTGPSLFMVDEPSAVMPVMFEFITCPVCAEPPEERKVYKPCVRWYMSSRDDNRGYGVTQESNPLIDDAASDPEGHRAPGPYDGYLNSDLPGGGMAAGRHCGGPTQ